jgi:hypothetical protein
MGSHRGLAAVCLAVSLVALPVWLVLQYQLHTAPISENQAFTLGWLAVGIQLAVLAAVSTAFYSAVARTRPREAGSAETSGDGAPFGVGVLFAVPFWVLWVVYTIFVRPEGSINLSTPYLAGDSAEVNNHGQYTTIGRMEYLTYVVVTFVLNLSFLCVAATTLVLHFRSTRTERSSP